MPVLTKYNQESGQPPDGRLLKVYPPEGTEDKPSVEYVLHHIPYGWNELTI